VAALVLTKHTTNRLYSCVVRCKGPEGVELRRACRHVRSNVLQAWAVDLPGSNGNKQVASVLDKLLLYLT
jgi:hypothetical protein